MTVRDRVKLNESPWLPRPESRILLHSVAGIYTAKRLSTCGTNTAMTELPLFAVWTTEICARRIARRGLTRV